MSEPKFFNPAADDWNGASLHWSRSDFAAYAEAYRQAARLLAERVLESESRRERGILILPVAFLYRHYLELRFKWMVPHLRRILGEPADVKFDHGIDRLWLTVRTLLTRANVKEDAAKISRMTELIHEFAVVDPTSQGLRYPVETSGKPSLGDLAGLDIRNFVERMNEVGDFLEELSVGVYMALDDKLEMEQEYRHEAGF